jgi:hypothetical protein
MNAERDSLRERWPAEFSDGARRAYSGDGLYPTGFVAWPLDKRNAWFAGFNVGYRDRQKIASHAG